MSQQCSGLLYTNSFTAYKHTAQQVEFPFLSQRRSKKRGNISDVKFKTRELKTTFISFLPNSSSSYIHALQNFPYHTPSVFFPSLTSLKLQNSAKSPSPECVSCYKTHLGCGSLLCVLCVPWACPPKHLSHSTVIFCLLMYVLSIA